MKLPQGFFLEFLVGILGSFIWWFKKNIRSLLQNIKNFFWDFKIDFFKSSLQTNPQYIFLMLQRFIRKFVQRFLREFLEKILQRFFLDTFSSLTLENTWWNLFWLLGVPKKNLENFLEKKSWSNIWSYLWRFFLMNAWENT